jgi:hypothetical protein
MRAKHIRRKKDILSNYAQFRTYPYYPYDGMYSKGKIHCSCPICACKTTNKNKCYGPTKNWKHSDLQQLQAMHDDLFSYYADLDKQA